MDGPVAMYSLLPPHFFTLYSRPSSAFSNKARDAFGSLSGSAAHLLAPLHPRGSSKGRYRVTDWALLFPGLQGWADGSKNKQVRCLWWNGPNKTNPRHCQLGESSFCSIIQPYIKCDIVKHGAKWRTMTPLELEWRRSFNTKWIITSSFIGSAGHHRAISLYSWPALIIPQWGLS